MTLKFNSLPAKLYRWFYSTNDMPQSLCPYFWKLTLMWIFILPYTLVSLPVVIMDGKDPWEDRTMGERLGYGFIVWAGLFMLISMLSWFGLFFAQPTGDSFWFLVLSIGFIGWAAAIILGAISLYKRWEERRSNYHIKNVGKIYPKKKSKRTSIIVEFAKAKYNKYCPKIEWDSE